MKKCVFVMLLFVLFSLAFAEDIPGKGMFYEYEDFSAVITGTYFYQEAGQDYILISAMWRNLWDGPLSFVYTFYGRAYQNGVELEHGFVSGFDMKGVTEILPGYGLESYLGFEIDGNDEVLISLRAFGDVFDETDPIEYTVIPSELPVFDISKAS